MISDILVIFTEAFISCVIYATGKYLLARYRRKPNSPGHIKTLNELLTQAAAEGNMEALTKLIHHGADPLCNNNEAIIRAAAGGHLEIVKYLESLDANVHDQDNMAIRVAALGCYFPVLKHLLERSYKYNYDVMRCVLGHVAVAGRLDIVKYLEELPGWEYIHYSINPDIMLAIANGNHTDIIDHYADRGLRYDIARIDKVLGMTTGNMETISSLLNIRLKSLGR